MYVSSGRTGGYLAIPTCAYRRNATEALIQVSLVSQRRLDQSSDMVWEDAHGSVADLRPLGNETQAATDTAGAEPAWPSVCTWRRRARRAHRGRRRAVCSLLLNSWIFPH